MIGIFRIFVVVIGRRFDILVEIKVKKVKINVFSNYNVGENMNSILNIIYFFLLVKEEWDN